MQLDQIFRQELDEMNSPIGMIRASPTGEILSANPTVLQSLGFWDGVGEPPSSESNALVGKNYDDVVHPFDTRFAQMIMIPHGQRQWTEKRYVHKNGEPVWTLMNVTPVHDESGDILHVFFAIVDISERKKTEERLANSEMRLRQSNSELQQFAAVASHDLKEPLRKILAFGSRLQSEMEKAPEGAMSEKAFKHLERVLNAGGRMEQLIEGLLDLARVETRAQPFEPTDLKRAVNEVLSDLETRIEQKEAKVHVSELPTIDADPLQIRLLFQNLIANGLKFHAEGKLPVVYVDGEIMKAGGEEYCKLVIRDEGIGLESEYAEKIFKPFQRLHGKDEYEGSGIGLAICKRIVERHYGEIHCTSKVGEGTSFTIMLPINQENSDNTNEVM